jgi:excisionase family DNA binding protein
MSATSTPHDGPTGVVLDTHMSVQAAAEYSGYNVQYLRRLVRRGEVEGVKVGQVWLVAIASLDAHLKRVQSTDDRRYGPRVYQAYINGQEE